MSRFALFLLLLVTASSCVVVTPAPDWDELRRQSAELRLCFRLMRRMEGYSGRDLGRPAPLPARTDTEITSGYDDALQGGRNVRKPRTLAQQSADLAEAIRLMKMEPRQRLAELERWAAQGYRP